MQLSDEAKALIEKYIEFIESEDYADLYDLIYNDELCINLGVIGEITRVLEAAGLDPLAYLDYIPAGYYCVTPKKQYIIPRNKKEINAYGFHYSELEEVEIPFNVSKIGEAAFSYCEDLKLVEIDNPDIQIEYDAFDYCDIDKIIYAGSRSDWEGFEFSDRAKFHVVECIDGDVNYI